MISPFPNSLFSIYDDLTLEHVPGQLKYDVCMTEQVSGPQGTKIAGRHMVMIPKPFLYAGSWLESTLVQNNKIKDEILFSLPAQHWQIRLKGLI